jgi:C1A family cysteine protease
MKKSTFQPGHCFSVGLVLVLLLQMNASASDELAHIKQAIIEKSANWTAGESWVTRLSPEEQKQLCGGRLPEIDPGKVKLLSLPKLTSAPAVFDWRDNNGNWMTPVKDQGWSTTSLTFICGSCWDFAAVAAIEAWWKIHNAKPDSQIDLSEQFVLSCGELDCWSGGSAEYVFNMASTTGIPTEACFPYKADDAIPCGSACANWQQEAVTIPGWGYITLNEANVENIKSALFRRPVVAYLVVYQDFLYYTEGVYEHVWGELRYGHLVVIVGWNDSEQSWICKNSFGTSWGDSGYFRIKWGECSIGQYCPYIWDNLTGGPALATTPEKFDLSLVAGDSLIESLTIRNLGTEPLEYSTSYWGGKGYFHPDSFMSYDGLSWWCGDAQIGGYQNLWLQYLDTPVLDLSTTNQPRLTWMGYWAVEDTTGISENPPYDGWDGCNVWISTDGGKIFAVAEPIKPQYDARNLYSFGDWWGMIENVPGWNGSSGGWQEVEFDLSSYRSDSLVVRFAFASDFGVATPDNPQLYGFFVDNILITDGGTVLFEDHGDDASHMIASGEASDTVNWIQVTNASGVLAQGESAEAKVMFGPRGLEPGEYKGRLIIFSNDTTTFWAAVPIELHVLRPEHDVQLQQAGLPANNLPILVPIYPWARIQNQGQSEENNFQVTCKASVDQQEVYSDTQTVASLPNEADTNIRFKPLVLTRIGNLDLVASLGDIPQDHNRYNNQASFFAHVGNFIDGFETETGFWHFEQGWTIETQGGHSGSCRVRTLQQPSLDCCLIFRPGFDLSAVDRATLKFWTRYNTEKDKDVCYVEASQDSMAWLKLDSLSGRQYPRWVQREISLSDFVGRENSRTWVRFHFISDSTNTNEGVFLDDIAIYAEYPTAVALEAQDLSLPAIWSLSQNYPNPFNPTTAISYQLPALSQVDVSVYNLLGQKVATLVSEKQAAGSYSVVWDATGFSAGVYFCRLVAGDPSTGAKQKFVKVIKLALVR